MAGPRPRLRASIVVPKQNAELAVDEIERCAPDRRFVQVLLLVSGELTLGGARTGRSTRQPNAMVCRWASMPAAATAIRYAGRLGDYYRGIVGQAGAFQSQLTSLISEGCSQIPGPDGRADESGVTWLPGICGG